MKKIFTVLLSTIVIIVFLSGCVNSSQFTVTCNDGTIEKISRGKLENLMNNELTYKEKYDGAYVSGKGKIYHIEKDSWGSDGTIDTVTVEIGSFTTKVMYVPADYVQGYNVGDEFEISGKLASTMNGFATIEADDFYSR